MNSIVITADSSAKPAWWRRRLLEPVLAQLRNGISPDKIAFTIAMGAMLGIFPVIGTTTILCLSAGFLLKLNQPVLHLVNYLVYPLELALILVFIRMGELLYHAQEIPFAIPEMLTLFHAAPVRFFREFAMTFVHCISAWLLVAPPGTALIYYSLRPALNIAARGVPVEKP